MKTLVIFHGFLPNDLVRPYFQQAHIYLLSSLNETGSIAMLEAAACGVQPSALAWVMPRTGRTSGQANRHMSVTNVTSTSANYHSGKQPG